MAEIKKLFKFGNIWGIGGFWVWTNSEYYIFSSRDTIIKEGKKISEYELKIEKKHPIFKDIELKHDDIDDAFTVDYEITFDPEKGKTDLNTGGVLGDNERHYKAATSLNLKEIISNSKDGERERERAKLRNYENELLNWRLLLTEHPNRSKN